MQSDETPDGAGPMSPMPIVKLSKEMRTMSQGTVIFSLMRNYGPRSAGEGGE